jgi:hypothetical protein
VRGVASSGDAARARATDPALPVLVLAAAAAAGALGGFPDVLVWAFFAAVAGYSLSGST